MFSRSSKNAVFRYTTTGSAVPPVLGSKHLKKLEAMDELDAMDSDDEEGGDGTAAAEGTENSERNDAFMRKQKPDVAGLLSEIRSRQLTGEMVLSSHL